jgi:hypothetical protein
VSTTTADILNSIADLITALSELLGTDTVQALVEMARDFGIGQPVKAGLQLLSKALGLVIGWIQALEQVATIPAFLEALGPALDELGDLMPTASGEELRQSGLDALAPVADSARVMIGLVDKLRRAATVVLEGILPAEALKNLRESVVGLDTTLKDMQRTLDTPPAAPAQGALPAGGTA